MGRSVLLCTGRKAQKKPVDVCRFKTYNKISKETISGINVEVILLKIGNLSSNEYMKMLRHTGAAQCPKCSSGTVRPIGEKEKAHWFVCDSCKFKIVEE